MAATTALRLGETVGCTSTDSSMDSVDVYRDVTGPIRTEYWPSDPPSTPPTPSTPTYAKNRQSACQQRFKLIHEGDIQVCRLNHTRTIVSKIMNSKYLRRWESHHIILDENEIQSSMVGILNCCCVYLCFQTQVSS